MRKLAYLFIGILFIFPIISFAVDDNGGLLSFLNFISEKIGILKEKISELIRKINKVVPMSEEIIPQGLVAEEKPVISTPKSLKKAAPSNFAPQKPETPVISESPAPVVSPPPFIPTPLVSAEEKPFVRLSANGSGGQISIKKGENLTLSWNLSNHNWSYCGRAFGWEGTIKPISGSEVVGPISYDTRYDIFCYINETKYTDSVTVFVTESKSESVATSSLPKSTFSITDPGFKTCFLEVSRNTIIMGKDALEATWIIDSDPRSAHFYWRGKDNGVDIGKVYGGKTQRIRIFDYGAYPAKYERYVEMFFSQEHYVDDPYTPGCTTNTVIFEVKQ